MSAPTVWAHARAADRSQRALVAALAVDNVGSGLFLPLAIVYATRVVGLSIETAGALVAAAGLLGLAVPPLAARAGHAFGPRRVVVASLLVQAAGAVGYLLSSSATGVFGAAALLSMGTQLFYCSVFVLIADLSRSEAKERPFALITMVRAGAFGLGTLASAVALSLGSDTALRWLVAADALSFLVAAALLGVLVVTPDVHHEVTARAGALTVLRDRAYLLLMLATCLVDLASDVALIGLPVYVLDVLSGPSWLPGALLATATLLSSVYGVRVVDALAPYRRTSTMQVGAAVFAVWALLTAAMVWLPTSGRGDGDAADDLTVVVVAFGVWLLWVAAGKIYLPVAGALSNALPPAQSRAGYMAMYQSAFTAAQVLSPAVVALFALSGSLPWLVVACGSLMAVGVVGAMRRFVPEHVDRRESEEPLPVG